MSTSAPGASRIRWVNTREWIGTWDFDVVAISETWIEQGQEWLLQVPGFRCFSQSRESGRREGGVALLVKDSITVAEKTFDVDLSIEVVWAEIRNRKGGHSVGSFL